MMSFEGTDLRDLEERGWVVIDGFFDARKAEEYRDEIRGLVAAGLMLPNKTQFGLPNGEVIVSRKPNIYEADLHDADLRARTPELGKLFDSDDLVDGLNSAMPDLHLTRGTGGKTIKLQHNTGNGGCFPLHYDNPGKPNKRKLTCLLYLNPNWSAGDGGELQLVPFLSEPVTIEPTMNRLVIFKSESVLHRVLPSSAERFCFTIWIDSAPSEVNRAEHAALRVKTGQSIREIADYMGTCPVQRIVSRALYREEYERSLRECMEGEPKSLATMLALHRAHLAAVEKHKALKDLVDNLRTLKT